MEPISLTFILAAFVAGIITFLAPCTLPLVPGYLSFISGSSVADLQDPTKAKKARLKIFLNGVFYVIGFSAVFILLGSLFGLGGAVFFQYRSLITRIGGVLIIFFGLFLLAPAITSLSKGKINLLHFPLFRFLVPERQMRVLGKLKPGTPFSSLMFGGTFAVGWTPCVGPILGAILTFAASSATVAKGAFLLFVFSLGLAVPFLLTALAIGWASKHFAKLGRYLNWVAIVGGVFLIILGIFMVTDSFVIWIAYVYNALQFLNYEEQLLDLL
ncbi:sulfite exporter TauE/SafE family protein [Patescibacteria group bacterium]|nr:sulfite exporter TauE/SafE family protein [Patescibacteria group bacterium]